MIITFCQLSTRRKKHRIKESGIKTSLEKLGTKNEWLDILGEIITCPKFVEHHDSK